MKTTLKWLCSLSIAIGSFQAGNAGNPAFQREQNKEAGSGNTAVGVRMGVPFGITYKKYMADHAIEIIAGVGHPGFGVTGLYEKSAEITGAPNLYWVYGAGAHVGFYGGYYYTPYGRYYYREYDPNAVAPNIGIDGLFGLEYRIHEIPFTIGLDIKPFLDVLYPSFGFDGALSIRFHF